MTDIFPMLVFQVYLMRFMIFAFLDGGLKKFYCKRKPSSNFERYQCDMLFKKKKIFDQSSAVISVGGFSSESVSNSAKKGITEDKDDSATILHGGPFLLY